MFCVACTLSFVWPAFSLSVPVGNCWAVCGFSHPRVQNIFGGYYGLSLTVSNKGEDGVINYIMYYPSHNKMALG